jgi:hypothetical protein
MALPRGGIRPKLLGSCGRGASLERPFLGLFDELPESGFLSNFFVVAMLIGFAHAWRGRESAIPTRSEPIPITLEMPYNAVYS